MSIEIRRGHPYWIKPHPGDRYRYVIINGDQSWTWLWNPDEWDQKMPMWRLRLGRFGSIAWWPHENERLKMGLWLTRRIGFSWRSGLRWGR